MPTGTNRTTIALPTEVSNEIIQKTQEQSAVMRLATHMTIPGRGVTLPVITADPEAGWVNETEKKPVSNPGLTTKMMQPYTLAVIVPFSNQFRRDMTALYNAIIARLPNALGKKFDATVFGAATGAPGSNFDVLGGAVGVDIASDAYTGLVTAKTNIATKGGIMNGIALSPQGESVLLLAKDGNDRPLFLPSMNSKGPDNLMGASVYATKGAFVQNNPSGKNTVGVAGDWTQAVYGTVAGVDITLSDQATLTIGGEQVNLWERNMFAVRAEIEVGFRADTNVFNLLTASAS